jgi:hypothetical protein|tara:strand:- start:4038 stop:5195 length:1158 start_codon:yes stop_codon:yes gene_type:complete
MHLLEHYALSCGAQISKPSTPTSYIPIPFTEYIVVSLEAEVESKKYDYYQDVISHITPLLKEAGIKIIQIGKKEDQKLKGVFQYLGTTKKHQNYLIQNSRLVLSNDFYSAHMAGILNKKLVTLFGPLYKDISKPFWGDASNQTLIESHRNGEKPSFSGQEKGYKRINLIFPEEIARAVLDLLQIPHPLENINTLYLGKHYTTPVIEAIPDFDPPPSLYQASSINLRLDLHFDPEIMSKWAFNRKLNIITDQKIERKYLDIIRPHVAQVMYKVSEKTEESGIREMQEGGYKLYLYTEDEENISDIRLKLIEWEVNLHKIKTKKELDKYSDICDNTCFKSSKIMTSKNKNYSSSASWKAGIEKHENEEAIDSPEFWKELDYLRIYNK